MAIEKDIHELLYRHDCVIVPRFGGFLTHYRTARLDEARQVVHPPSKDVSFNMHLIRNDGLLVDHVSRHEGVGYEAASARIDQEVDAWEGRLKKEGRLELSRIGTFFKDQEANLQFEPDRRVNFLRDAYGLRPVAAVPVERKAKEFLKEGSAASLADVPNDGTRRPIIWAAAVVSGVMVLATAFWFLRHEMPSGAQWSGLAPFSVENEQHYQQRVELPAALVEIDDVHEWKLPEGEGIHHVPLIENSGVMVAVDLGEVHAAPAVADSTAVAVPVITSKYHVIGGCFELEENATRFVKDLQARGFDAHRIDLHKGLYRVAYGSYPHKDMALEALSALRKEEAPEAWLLVK